MFKEHWVVSLPNAIFNDIQDIFIQINLDVLDI